MLIPTGAGWTIMYNSQFGSLTILVYNPMMRQVMYSRFVMGLQCCNLLTRTNHFYDTTLELVFDGLVISNDRSGLSCSLWIKLGRPSHNTIWSGILAWSYFQGRLTVLQLSLNEIDGTNELEIIVFSGVSTIQSDSTSQKSHNELKRASSLLLQVGIVRNPEMTTLVWLTGCASLESIGPDRSHPSLLLTATGPSSALTTSPVTTLQ